MQSRNLTTKGVNRYDTYSYEFTGEVIIGVPQYRWNLTTSFNDSQNFQDNLTVYFQNVGDRKNPNPLFWAKTGFTRNQGYSLSGDIRGGYNSSYTIITGPAIAAYPLQDTSNKASQTVAYNKAVDNLLEKLRGSLDLSVSVAEWRQTLKMFQNVRKLEQYVVGVVFNGAVYKQRLKRDIGLSIRSKSAPKTFGVPQVELDGFGFRAQVAHVYRRLGSDVKKTHHAKWMGSRWLEYQFGIKPLVSDLYDTFKTCMTVPNRNYHTFFGQASDTESESATDGDVVSTKESSYRVRLVGYFDLTPSTVTELGRFTSLNPLSIAWELTHFSFLVDYVFNIGSYLRSLETAFLYRTQFVTGSLTYTQKVEINSVLNKRTVTATTVDIKSAKYTSSFKSLNRSVLVSIPMPRPPAFKINMGSGRMLNVAALLSQKLRL